MQSDKADVSAGLDAPYQSPEATAPASREKRRWPVSLILHTAALLFTAIFATKNTLEEGHEIAGGGLLLIAIACVSQLPGLAIGLWRWKTRSGASLCVLAGAYAIAITGLLVFTLYAFDGKADSLNSAAHMHVIMFPILHCVFAFLVYGVTGTIAIILSLATKT